nr:hypothetical protein [Tanacetum cinerariifolium]
MEVLSLMIKRKIEDEADIHSVKLLKSALDDFSKVSGLLPSLEKTCEILGVPLISSKLYKQDCESLIDKINEGFLWSHGVLKAGQAKVNWEDVNSYRLIDRISNARNFWDIPTLSEVCWSWRKIFQCRDVLIDHIVYRIGDGVDTLVCQNIPRHALMLWLAIHQKLKTQDRNGRWMGVEDLKSSSCETCYWGYGLLYWQARNLGFFQQKKRHVKVLCSIIVENIRLRMMSLKIRGSKQSLDVADI